LCDNEVDSNRRGLMTRVRTTQRSSLGFRFLIIPFLLLLVVALTLGKPAAYAEPPIGLAPSGEQSLSAPSVITIPTRGMPDIPTQVPSRSVSAVGGFQNCDITATVGQPQMSNLGDFWHSFRPSGGQMALQLPIQREPL